MNKSFETKSRVLAKAEKEKKINFYTLIFWFFMARDTGINLPAGFGGLVRFKEEYESLFMLKPAHVIVFVIIILLLRVFLPFFVRIPQ